MFIRNAYHTFVNKIAIFVTPLYKKMCLYGNYMFSYATVYKHFMRIMRKPIRYKYKLSLAAIFKNEASYIVEWIEYYILMGVEHFYLYDNGSDDNATALLEPYIQQGYVTLHSFAGVGRQEEAYKNAVKNHKLDTKWMVIVDLDEFILPKHRKNIQDMLDDYEQYDQVCCRWLLFGNSGYLTRPEGLVIENYLRRIEAEKSWLHKCIIKPIQFVDMTNPHDATVTGETLYLPHDVVQCNHYFCKSYVEYRYKKNTRNRQAQGTDINGFYKYDIGYFHGHNFNDVYDDSLLPFVHQIKKNARMRKAKA